MSINEQNDKIVRLDIFMTVRELSLMKKLAADAGVPFTDYVNNIVVNWLAAQLRGQYDKLFRQMNIHELANLFGDILSDGTVNFSTSAVNREKLKIKDKYKDKYK